MKARTDLESKGRTRDIEIEQGTRKRDRERERLGKRELKKKARG